MENRAPVKSFLQELIKPIVVDAVNEAIPKVVRTEPKEYLSVEEVEEEYHISSSTVYRRFDSGDLTKVKNGKRTLVKRVEIEKALKEGTLVAIDERGCRRGRKSK